MDKQEDKPPQKQLPANKLERQKRKKLQNKQPIQLNPSLLTKSDQRYQKYRNNRNNKPSIQQIRAMYPNMIQVQIPKERNWNNQDFRQTLQNAHQIALRDHLDPQQVYNKLKDNDKQYMDIYRELKQYVSTRGANQKMRQYISAKVIKQTSQKLKIPLKDAMCVLVLDDFYDSIKQYGSKAYDYAKNFVRNNKETIHDFLSSIIQSTVPATKPIFDAAWTAFGGSVLSEDPNAIDQAYMRCIFGAGPARPCPRRQNHYMYQMSSRSQVPITTLADGTAILVITPYSSLYGNYIANWNYLPFIHVASTSSTNPFSAAGSYNVVGPFSTQLANVMTYAPDYLYLDYINTESSLQCKGRFQISFFYQPPNKTWKRSQITGLYNTTAISITDYQLTNNIGYVSRKSNIQCQRLSRIGTYISEQNKDQAIPAQQVQAVGSDLYGTMPFIIIKFSNCTPSTQIGTVFITTGISIQPTANMRGILQVQPRGSYQGTYRALKQSRKMGVPLQFLSPQQASYLYVNNFHQVNFSNYKNATYGEGQVDLDPSFERITNSKAIQGMCVSVALTQLGIANNIQAYPTITDISKYTSNTILKFGRQIIFDQPIKAQQQYIYLDKDNRHAVSVRYLGYNTTSPNRFIQKTSDGYRDVTDQLAQQESNNRKYKTLRLLLAKQSNRQ